ncbi:ketoacyl-ACP synthase III [Flavobacterium sp. Fl-318]|uniref:Ketoacyl-ACP synthase III n=1 Tax=Flavobacterium cupriresistens TaxID=2893885 RepID=A0ABU4R6J7_9FLAO|nr:MULTISPECIES: ketoacyl-ACP synthase III [unclassified Flavobacterium]MDX6188209.1 ketoacyl-ACP synthase III [Flavobacterium sp. Fl-318]UFH40747.1 ketoacyl-ACP synthase III [Flavobacterium sp. F-323]
MATFSVNNIAIKGISCCVPKNTERNIDLDILTQEEIQKFIDATGVEERRVATKEICTSDLCSEAAEKLIKDLNWQKEEIEILVFVSQTADYILPVSAAILQDRLGLSTNCIAFDVPLGCSGYVYGMSIIAGMMKATGLKKGLLLAGDTSTKLLSKSDKSTVPLFGDGGSATAFEFDEKAADLLFDLGTDGSGYKTIIINDGGSRNRINSDSLTYHTISPGIERNACQLILDGMDVFSFGISQAPKTVNKLIEKFDIDKEAINHFVFHQANLMMNKMIVKKLKLPLEKVPYSLKEFGNTSSTTIPLTIVTELKDNLTNASQDLILCGFGVGLSWGTVKVRLENTVISDLIEI